MRTKFGLNLDKALDRTFLIVYCIWIIININLLIINWPLSYTKEVFPFKAVFVHNLVNDPFKCYFCVYDYTEFLAYTIIPLILFFVYKLIKPAKRE